VVSVFEIYFNHTLFPSNKAAKWRFGKILLHAYTAFALSICSFTTTWSKQCTVEQNLVATRNRNNTTRSESVIGRSGRRLQRRGAARYLGCGRDEGGGGGSGANLLPRMARFSSSDRSPAAAMSPPHRTGTVGRRTGGRRKRDRFRSVGSLGSGPLVVWHGRTNMLPNRSDRTTAWLHSSASAWHVGLSPLIKI